MTTQTILRIPAAHRKYAVETGARNDPEQRVWYVNGEIPPTLADYVPTTRRARDYTQETVPSCPSCGRAMIWIDADIPFWGCSRYRNVGCRGNRRAAHMPQAASRLASPETGSNDVVCTSTRVRQIHLTRILSQLHQHLESNDRILHWLNENRVEFKDQSALDIMGTREGFRRVEKFIIETFQPS